LKRESIWLHLLETNNLSHINYLELKQNVELNREEIKNVDEVILLDVHRSEH